MKKLLTFLICVVVVLSTVFAFCLKNMNDHFLLLDHKTVYVYGDSIAWGQSAPGETRGPDWPGMFGKLTGAEVINCAEPGTCLAKASGYGIMEEKNMNAFCDRVDREDFSSADYLMIAYGTIDYGFVIEMGNDDSTDKNTFKGAWNYILKKLTAEYPHMKIILLTPMYADTADVKNIKGYTLEDYAEAIRHIASLYNLPVIDLFHGMGINEYNRPSLYWDELHPRVETQKRIADYVYQQFPGEIPITQGAIKEIMPPLGGYNLISEDTFQTEKSEGLFSAKYMEKGLSFSLAPGMTVQSSPFLEVTPGEVLYMTFWCNSLEEGQYFEADLYSDGILTNAVKYPAAGEQFMVCKFEIPESAVPGTLYQLRFSALPGNTGALNIGSVMLTRSNFPMNWEPNAE